MSTFNQIGALILFGFIRNAVPYYRVIAREYVRLHSNYILLLPFNKAIRFAKLFKLFFTHFTHQETH